MRDLNFVGGNMNMIIGGFGPVATIVRFGLGPDAYAVHVAKLRGELIDGSTANPNIRVHIVEQGASAERGSHIKNGGAI
jgi:hypothetical protein